MEALRERFGKYHVLEKIAQGGMAEVYKVKTVGIAGFEKIQALKRILPHSAREARFIRSFIDEARIAVELTHRNIVQVFDFGKADGELFLAMELIEGKDLRTVMTQAATRDALPEVAIEVAIAAYIISEVASGLDYAHRKADGYGGPLGIVHCDVSPSNVMLSTEGDIKILDFGIARATFASALERRRLRGKPRYMSPEQTTGETPTAASDVFALGIIAWELFTGAPLYRGHDLKAVLEAVRRTDPPRIDALNPRVPGEIADAVATALRRDPEARGTAADLVNACARAAMPASPRVLARWLKDLESRPVRSVTPWHGEGTMAGMRDLHDGPAAALGHDAPLPPRPSATVSLHDAAVPVIDAPVTPVVRAARAAAPARSARIERTEQIDPIEPIVERTERVERVDPADLGDRPVWLERRPRAEPAEPTRSTTTTTAAGRFEPDASTTQAGRYEPAATHPTAPRFDATATAQQPFDPAQWAAPPAQTGASASGRWQPEATVTGHARLADALPMETVADAVAGAAETTPFVRRSYERLELAAGVAPSALRFDDDATHHGFALPPSAPDDTSYDELDVEPEPPAPAAAPSGLGDAPIDDDLGQAAGGALAERRRIVLVAGLLSGAPPDALRPVTKSLGELAYQRGGVVLELEPAALIVAFGLEIAGEDDVAIAMGWALDAAAMARDTAGDTAGDGGGHTGGHTETVQVRIGARAGVATAAPSAAAPTVTMARTPDAAPRIPADAIDDARALAREAAPDRPLFVGGAGRLTSSLYALRELPAGRRIARRSRVLEVIGPRSFDERDRARLERRGKFVGRTAQLAELDAWFQRAIAAERRLCVLITGAAGTGKSRLVAELVARWTSPAGPIRVITTAASPASRMAPFATVIDLYQAALGLPPARGRTARAQVVHRLYPLLIRAGISEERARAVTIDLDRAMELRDGLGVAAREAADLRPRISAGLAAFRTVMTSRERPALLVIEDIHLADSASLEVTRQALAMPAPGAELLVLTARPEGPPPPPADAVIALDDLSGAELRALITDRLGDAAAPLAIATVLARSGGNPLFVEELAQAVRDAGAAGEDVPATARDVVSARVDRLPPKAKTALRYASVLGGTVRARLLEELLGEDSLEHELDEVVSAGFLVRPDGAAGSAEGELAFARGLVREVVYESLSARAQRDTHARVGRLLASRFFAGREEPPSAIAEHLERGGELAGAAAFWLRAGRLALSASDADAAIACFTRTLALERELGAAPPTPASKARRREALAGREEARRLQGDLASDPGDLDELERLSDGEPARLADVEIRRAQRMMRLGDYYRRERRHRPGRAPRDRRRRRPAARRGAARARRDPRAGRPVRRGARGGRCGARAVPPPGPGHRRDGGDGRPRPDPPPARALRGGARRLPPGARPDRQDRRPVARAHRQEPRRGDRDVPGQLRRGHAVRRALAGAVPALRRSRPRGRCAQRRRDHPLGGRALRSGRPAVPRRARRPVAHQLAVVARRLPDLHRAGRAAPRRPRRPAPARRGARRGPPARRALPRGQRADRPRRLPPARRRAGRGDRRRGRRHRGRARRHPGRLRDPGPGPPRARAVPARRPPRRGDRAGRPRARPARRPEVPGGLRRGGRGRLRRRARGRGRARPRRRAPRPGPGLGAQEAGAAPRSGVARRLRRGARDRRVAGLRPGSG